MSSPNDRIVIDLETIQKWAEQPEDTEPIYYAISTDEFSIYIERDHNMTWQYGIGTKSEHHQEFFGSNFFRSRAEMAKALLNTISMMKEKISGSEAAFRRMVFP